MDYFASLLFPLKVLLNNFNPLTFGYLNGCSLVLVKFNVAFLSVENAAEEITGYLIV